MLVMVFFCKQKTAYEMRISDWSSDVCSSDLALVAAGLAAATLAAVPAVRAQGSQVQNASSGVMLAVGRGTLVKLDRPMSDVFIADPAIADIHVRSPSLLYIFGKGPGETSIYSTDKAGEVTYSTNFRVGTNYDQVRPILRYEE